MICAAYIASYLFGISLLNLNGDSKLITTFVKYHFYYQIRKFMHHPDLIDQYDVSAVRKHIPIIYKEEESVGKDGDGDTFIYRVAVESSSTDWRSFIAYSSDGLTEVGQKLFQESLESFNYCVLGAEARTRWSVVGKGAKSSQTQDVFRKIVEDTVVQNDSTVLISNMKRSIQATNVVLNLAVVPNVILMPSNFVILSKKIAGYNNVLTTATTEMKFGVNKDVNYSDPTESHDSSINDNKRNDTVGGRGNTSNDRSDVHDNVSGYSKINERSKTATKAEQANRRELTQLPIAVSQPAVVFIVSLLAGVIMSKKLFS